MEWLYTASAATAAETKAKKVFGVPGIVLMENAGREAARITCELCPDAEKILILCGPGNNGGDGLIAARHLSLMGRDVSVVCTAADDRYSGDAAVALGSCTALAGVTIDASPDLEDEDLDLLFNGADVVIDALLGTGSHGLPRGEVARLIRMLTDRCRIRDEVAAADEAARIRPYAVISLDIPSGVDPDTGEIADDFVRADATISFMTRKVGSTIAPGSICAGEVIIAQIGVPDSAAEGPQPIAAYGRADIGRLLPRMPKDAHKGDRGGLLVIGGSECYRGAPLLAARAALRAGCGFVYLAVPEYIAAAASVFIPEAIVFPIPVDENGNSSASAIEDAFAPWASRIRAAVVGPGIGRSDAAELMVRRSIDYLKVWNKPLLLDADALFHVSLSEYTGIPNTNLVITPHAGEASRLLRIPSDDVDAHRLDAVRKLADRYGTALLKGPHTLISSGGETRTIVEGGPQLSVPGSGDVLSGIIGGLLARGMSAFDAATLGALVHACAGDESGVGDGLLASEIADLIPEVLKGADL